MYYLSQTNATHRQCSLYITSTLFQKVQNSWEVPKKLVLVRLEQQGSSWKVVGVPASLVSGTNSESILEPTIN